MCLSAWAEGDSPMFAAKRVFSRTAALPAAKIGTVPWERLQTRPRPTWAFSLPPRRAPSRRGRLPPPSGARHAARETHRRPRRSPARRRREMRGFIPDGIDRQPPFHGEWGLVCRQRPPNMAAGTAIADFNSYQSRTRFSPPSRASWSRWMDGIAPDEKRGFQGSLRQPLQSLALADIALGQRFLEPLDAFLVPCRHRSPGFRGRGKPAGGRLCGRWRLPKIITFKERRSAFPRARRRKP